MTTKDTNAPPGDVRCPRCDQPVATAEQWRTVPEGEGDGICWGQTTGSCSPVDWRARALRAETHRSNAVALVERLRDRARAHAKIRDDLISRGGSLHEAAAAHDCAVECIAVIGYVETLLEANGEPSKKDRHGS